MSEIMQAVIGFNFWCAVYILLGAAVVQEIWKDGVKCASIAGIKTATRFNSKTRSSTVVSPNITPRPVLWVRSCQAAQGRENYSSNGPKGLRRGTICGGCPLRVSNIGSHGTTMTTMIIMLFREGADVLCIAMRVFAGQGRLKAS